MRSRYGAREVERLLMGGAGREMASGLLLCRLRRICDLDEARLPLLLMGWASMEVDGGQILLESGGSGLTGKGGRAVSQPPVQRAGERYPELMQAFKRALIMSSEDL